MNKTNTELLVLVTPELVRPVPKGQPRPDLKMPIPFMKGTRPDVPQSPGMDVTGPVPVKPAEESVPVEQLIQNMKALPSTSQQSQPQIQFVPMLTQPGQAAQPVAPPASPAAPPPSSAAGSPTGTGGGSGSNR